MSVSPLLKVIRVIPHRKTLILRRAIQRKAILRRGTLHSKAILLLLLSMPLSTPNLPLSSKAPAALKAVWLLCAVAAYWMRVSEWPTIGWFGRGGEQDRIPKHTLLPPSCPVFNVFICSSVLSSFFINKFGTF